MTTPCPSNSEDPVVERALHEHFEEVGRDLPPGVLLPPGDDLGMVDHEGPILIGTDQVVLGRHVRTDESPYVIGRKAVLRNLSDVAAMATSGSTTNRWSEAERAAAQDATPTGGRGTQRSGSDAKRREARRHVHGRHAPQRRARRRRRHRFSLRLVARHGHDEHVVVAEELPV